MRTFEHFPQDTDHRCPVCGTSEDKESVLVPVVGTEDGNISQAAIVHVDCLIPGLFFYPEQEFIGLKARHKYREV